MNSGFYRMKQSAFFSEFAVNNDFSCFINELLSTLNVITQQGMMATP